MRYASAIIAILLLIETETSAAEGGPTWTSRNRVRVVLAVDAPGRHRTNSPASVKVNFQRLLAEQGVPGHFDESTTEVEAFSHAASNEMASRKVPYRVDRLFGADSLTLSFVMFDQSSTNYLVYFDTVESGLGNSTRYHGLIGDGDGFCESYGRREIAASHFDAFCDFDGDGDLDLFKGGVEPFVYCYENIGNNRLVERGRLSSGGKLFTLPCSKSSRSWVSVAFYDIDGDGDQDFFPSFGDGPDSGQIIFYRNVTRESEGQLTFKRVGPLRTRLGVPLAGGPQAGGWFPSIAFVKDWNGTNAGIADALVGSNNRCWLYRNLGTNADGTPLFAEPVAVQAGGADIVLTNPRFDCADIDGDGDLDLFAATQTGPVYLFENIGSSTKAAFAGGKPIAWTGKYLIGDAHSGIKVADFDGDGLLDVVSGRFWERADLNTLESGRDFGGFYKNVGSRARPRFERRSDGSPFTEQFQICDAIRQNCVRAVDWNDDGKLDLLAGDTDGFIWFFENRSRTANGGMWSEFAPGQKIRAGAAVLSMAGSGGHIRFDICDWNNDGRKDLVAACGNGTVVLFLNQGTRSKPELGPAHPILTDGRPIQVGARASVTVCDWNNDDRKDLLLADEKRYYFCKNIGTDADPVLAAPTAIAFGGKPVNYARPNLGSFIDWDGDGKRDLIGCQFENTIRLYRNIGSGARGAEPQFADPDGLMLIQGESPQMISGVDAIDWNGDGSIDIITGQGHGGSGLRFYAHDWIEDELHKTHPIVSIVNVQTRNTQ